jgi:O-antigen ligase
MIFLFVCSVGTFQAAGKPASSWLIVLIPWGLVVLGFWMAPASRLAALWLDPLGLASGSSPTDRLVAGLPWLLYAVALLSLLVSPVWRAGLVAIVMLPAYILLPAALRAMWWPLLPVLERPVRERSAQEQAVEGRRLPMPDHPDDPDGLDNPVNPLARAMTILAGAIAAVALWQSLGVWQSWAQGSRVALPLGHHNLQAAATVALWPFALVLLKHRRRVVALALAALGLQLLVLVGTRSLGAALAVAVQLTALSWLWSVRWRASRNRLLMGRARKVRTWSALLVGAGLLLPLLVLAPRLLSVVRGNDSSALARLAYWRGALVGLRERPVLGWGPGSSHWTLAEHWTPIPGVHPPGEIVADPHSLPLLLGYELGIGGFALAAAMALLLLTSPWRRACLPATESPETAPSETQTETVTLATAAWLGLVGVAVTSLFLAAPSVPAPAWITVALVALLGGGTPGSGWHGAPAVASSSAAGASRFTPGAATLLLRLGAPVGLALALTILLRPLLAVGVYEEGRGAWFAGNPGSALEKVDQARQLDPYFPLYGFRQALLMTELEDRDTRARVRVAFESAELARGLAPLWLVASTSMLAAEQAEARAGGAPEQLFTALERACALAPLEGVAPLLAARLFPAGTAGPRLPLLARAILAEPGFLAASSSFPYPNEGRSESTLGVDEGRPLKQQILAWPDVPAGLKVAMADFLDALARSEESLPAVAGTTERRFARLAFAIDQEAATSLSLHAFRRQPWPGVVARIRVDEGMFDSIDATLPRATVLRETGPRAFVAGQCGVIASTTNERSGRPTVDR